MTIRVGRGQRPVAVDVHYYLGSQRVALRVEEGQEDNVYWLHTDHLGSTSLLTDESGDLELGTTTRFLPFGDYRTEPDSDLTDKGFTGHAHNDPLGLVFMQARFFVPGVGRFASADIIIPDLTDPRDLNRYSYVRNSPLVHTDPTGHCIPEYNCPGDNPFPPYPGLPEVDPNWQDDFSEDWTTLDDWQHPAFIPPLNPLPDPSQPYGAGHRGIDYPDEEGSNLHASTLGLVVISDPCTRSDCIQLRGLPGEMAANVNGGYGNVVIIEYGYGSLPDSVRQKYGIDPGESLYVLYGHLVDPLTSHIGDVVEMGTVFGGLGNTGNSSGPHLHMEIRVGQSGRIWDTTFCTSECGEAARTWWGLPHYDPAQVLE